MNKKDFWSGVFSGLLIAAFLVCCIVCGKIIYNSGQSDKDLQQMVTEQQNGQQGSISDKGYDSVMDNPEVNDKVQMLEGIIDKFYVYDVSQNAIEDGIYDGVMEALDDPYAAYYSPEEFVEIMNSTEGIYYGIGAILLKDKTTTYPKITGIIDNSPAAESELRVDDIIYKVNGEDIYDQELTEIVSKIKGEEGTFVTLTIIRNSTGEELEIELERRKVESPTVTYELCDRENTSLIEDDTVIGYLAISEFDDVTVDQFAEGLATVKGNGVDALILDLRGNPGGSLTAVVDIARMLLPEGMIVYTEDKYGQREEYTCDGKHELDIPLVVLVNGGSASASEILSGAIKDYKIGTLVGTTTYGKGIVQRLISLNDGSAVKLTVSHYYTPLGNDIHEVGITPDVEMEFDMEAYLEDETDNQIDKAISILLEELQ